MRKIFFHSIFILALFVSATSCKKESLNRTPAMQPDQIVSARIAANQTYNMDLSNEGSVTIIQQAAHFSVSQTAMNTVKGGSTYMYTPAKDFIGNDEVVFLSTKTSVNASSIAAGGCQGGNRQNDNSVSTISKHIIVKITVGN